MICKITIFCEFFSTEKKFVKFVKFLKMKKFVKFEFSIYEAGSPSNTMSPGPRPISVPSGILIHPTVWPRYINVTDRQTGQIG